MSVDPVQTCAPELTAYSQAVAARRLAEAAEAAIKTQMMDAAERYMAECVFGTPFEVLEDILDDLDQGEESEVRELLEILRFGDIRPDLYTPDNWIRLYELLGEFNDLGPELILDPFLLDCLSDWARMFGAATALTAAQGLTEALRRIEADRLKDYMRCIDAARFQSARRAGLIPSP